MRSPGPWQRTNTADNSGYTPDGPPIVSGALRQRTTGDHLDAPATSKGPNPATPKPPIVDVRHLTEPEEIFANQRN